MDLKDFHGKPIVIVNRINLEVKKVILRGSTKMTIRFNNLGEDSFYSKDKNEIDAYLEDDLKKVKEVTERFLKVRMEYLALSAIKIEP